MKLSLLLMSLVLCGSALAQDKYHQFLSNKIVATKIPKMKPQDVRKRLHSVTYQELHNFALVRVRAPIAGLKSFTNLTYSELKNTPELKFATGKPSSRLNPGDWVRILSVSQEDMAELEVGDRRRIEIGNFANGTHVYSMIALKMSKDFKHTEFYLLNAVAEPTDEVAEFEVFKKDILATSHSTHITEIEAGDLVMSSSEMKFGIQERWLGANTPLVVESVTNERQPWRFVWKYTLNLRILDCPAEFKATNCRGTYEEEYMRKPMVFMSKIRMR